MNIPDVVQYIVPPSWRWAILAAIVLLAADGVSGRGFLGGYGAYAAAQDVQIILELQYAEVIRDLHREICSIKPDRNPIWESVLDSYKQRYSELTDKEYVLPSCFYYPDDSR